MLTKLALAYTKQVFEIIFQKDLHCLEPSGKMDAFKARGIGPGEETIQNTLQGEFREVYFEFSHSYLLGSLS